MMEMQLFAVAGLCTTLLIQPLGDAWPVLHELASTWTNHDISLTWSWLWLFCCCPTRKGIRCPIYAVMCGRLHPCCPAVHIPVAGPCLFGSKQKHAGLDGDLQHPGLTKVAAGGTPALRSGPHI